MRLNIALPHSDARVVIFPENEQVVELIYGDINLHIEQVRGGSEPVKS